MHCHVISPPAYIAFHFRMQLLDGPASTRGAVACWPRCSAFTLSSFCAGNGESNVGTIFCMGAAAAAAMHCHAISPPADIAVHFCMQLLDGPVSMRGGGGMLAKVLGVHALLVMPWQR